jgi:hypothetical protein
MLILNMVCLTVALDYTFFSSILLYSSRSVMIITCIHMKSNPLDGRVYACWAGYTIIRFGLSQVFVLR